jgi:hypothetical protein
LPTTRPIVGRVVVGGRRTAMGAAARAGGDFPPALETIWCNDDDIRASTL